jgi:hypothetical protein
MSDIIEEASSLIECKECPWYKACLMPMRFTMEDLIREVHQVTPGTNLNQMREQEFQNLLLSMASTAQNILLEGCPIFIRRLKSSPKLAEQLKKMMQTWGTVEDPTRREG